jgi:hypothetical protein
MGVELPDALDHRTPVFVVDWRFDDERDGIRVLLKPYCDVIEARRPHEDRIRGQTAQSRPNSDRVNAVAPDVKNLHEAE